MTFGEFEERLRKLRVEFFRSSKVQRAEDAILIMSYDFWEHYLDEIAAYANWTVTPEELEEAREKGSLTFERMNVVVLDYIPEDTIVYIRKADIKDTVA